MEMEFLGMDKSISVAEYAKVVETACNEYSKYYGQELSSFWIEDHIKKAREGCHEFDALLQEKLNVNGSLRILDLCCGWGEYVVNLCFNGIECYGADICDDIYKGLVLARENKIQSPFIKGDGFSIPFQSETFDIVYSFAALEHIEKPQELLRDIYRVIKPGGNLFLTFPNPLYPIDGHTFLWFVPYLPHSLAEKYVKLRKKRRKDDQWDVWYHRRTQVYGWLRNARFNRIEVYPPNRFLGKNLKKRSSIKKLILLIANFLDINISKYLNLTSTMIFLIMIKKEPTEK